MLSGLVVEVQQFDTVPVSFNARVYADVPPTATGGTDTEGAVLGNFTGTVPAKAASAAATNYTVSVPASAVPLVAGVRYWVELSGGTLDAGGFSNQAWTSQGGAPATTKRIGGFYNTNQNPNSLTVLVNANPTPEPSALAALGLGAVAFVKRRRKA